MAMKPDKVVLFAILLVDRAKNLAKCNRWLRVLRQLTNRNIARLRYSCIVYEYKRKDVHGHGPSKLNLGLFVCCSDVYWDSQPFFPINYQGKTSSCMNYDLLLDQIMPCIIFSTLQAGCVLDVPFMSLVRQKRRKGTLPLVECGNRGQICHPKPYQLTIRVFLQRIPLCVQIAYGYECSPLRVRYLLYVALFSFFRRLCDYD